LFGRRRARQTDRQRNAPDLVVEVGAFVEAVVCPVGVAVVGGEDDHGVVGPARCVERGEDAADGFVDQSAVQVRIGANAAPFGLVDVRRIHAGPPGRVVVPRLVLERVVEVWRQAHCRNQRFCTLRVVL